MTLSKGFCNDAFIRKGIVLDNRAGNQCWFEMFVQSRAENIRQVSDQYLSLNKLSFPITLHHSVWRSILVD